MSLEPIRYKDRLWSIIDQLQIPQNLVYMDTNNVADGWNAIKNMNTRGIQ